MFGNLNLLVATPVWFLYLMIFLVGFGFIMFVVIFWKTPAWPWLKALLLRRLIIGIARGDKQMAFETPKVENESAKCKKYGRFEVNPDAVWNWYGAPVQLVLADNVAGLTPSLMSAATSLEKGGFENYTEAEIASYLAQLQKQTKEDISIEYLTKKLKIQDPRFLNYATNIINKGLHKKMGDNPSYYSVAFQNLRRYFKYNATPQGMEKVINAEKAITTEKLSGGFQFKFDHIIAISILLIIAAFAYLIIQQGGAGEVGGAIADTAKSVGGAGKDIAGGVGVK